MVERALHWRPVEFEKWHALGNDYVILEAADLPFELTEARIQAICASHTGVSADGILLLSEPEQSGTSPACGSSTRTGQRPSCRGTGHARRSCTCAAMSGRTPTRSRSRPRPARSAPGSRRTPNARSTWAGRPSRAKAIRRAQTDGRGELSAGGRTWRFQFVQVGNPQCAIRVADEPELATLDIRAIGPEIEHHDLFPNRTNVSWFTARSRTRGRGRIRARIFERGVGETSASGTGATGAAVAYVLDGGSSPVTVVLDGGELGVEVSGELEIKLSGWAVPVFRGTLAEDLHRGAECDASSRLDRIPPYMFAELERKVRTKREAGVDVISLGIGDPDTPTYPPIVAAAQRAVADPSTHQYPTQPRPEGVPRGRRRVLPPPLRRRA